MILKLIVIFSILSKCIHCEISDFIEYKSKCKTTRIAKNGTKIDVEGIHTIFLQCWWLRIDAKAGLGYEKFCEDDEVCRDLVCCEGKSGELDYDPIERYIYPRLLSSDPCKIRGTNISGVYKRKSECPENVEEHKVCRFDFCENFVCCPLIEAVDPVYKAVEGKCLFETEEERLTETIGNSKPGCTCRPYFQCPNIRKSDVCVPEWQKNSICGYDDCGTPFVCCSEVNEKHKNSKSFFGNFFYIPTENLITFLKFS